MLFTGCMCHSSKQSHAYLHTGSSLILPPSAYSTLLSMHISFNGRKTTDGNSVEILPWGSQALAPIVQDKWIIL